MNSSSNILKLLIFIMVIGIVITMLFTFYKLKAESDQSQKKATELKNIVSNSPTPVKPISSCLVLEEKYCNKGKKLLYNNKYPMIGLNLPVNANIYSPLTGNISLSTAIFKKDNKSYPYTSILIDSNLTYALVFNYDATNQKKGQVVQNQPIGNLTAEKIDFFGDYNLIVYVMKKEKNLLTIDEEQTLKLFKLDNKK